MDFASYLKFLNKLFVMVTHLIDRVSGSISTKYMLAWTHANTVIFVLDSCFFSFSKSYAVKITMKKWHTAFECDEESQIRWLNDFFLFSHFLISLPILYDLFGFVPSFCLSNQFWHFHINFNVKSWCCFELFPWCTYSWLILSHIFDPKLTPSNWKKKPVQRKSIEPVHLVWNRIALNILKCYKYE